MKSSQKSKKTKQGNASIDLPAQKVWKELENHGVESSLNESSKLKCEKVKKIGLLLDKAFELLLEKLIRQN